MMTRFQSVLGLLCAAVLFTACETAPEDQPKPAAPASPKGLLVLNEGLFGRNNASLSLLQTNVRPENAPGINFQDFFNALTGRGLGDTANDLIRYGDRIYVVVNISSTIEVLDARTLKHLRQIEVKNGATGRQPRYAAGNNGKLYVTCYDDNVVVIDTATFATVATIPVGRDPEGILSLGTKLYVANSGALSTYDNRVSVIDAATNTVTANWTVADNLFLIAADKGGDIYVSARATYDPTDWSQLTPSAIHVLNAADGSIKQTLSLNSGSFALRGDSAFVLTSTRVALVNTQTDAVSNANWLNLTTNAVANPYNISTDPVTGEVYVTDAKDYVRAGDALVFDRSGAVRFRFATGLLPSRVLRVN